jgi:hypothetical protein
MATCEYHDEYGEYLTGQMAVKLVGREGRDARDWNEAWDAVKTIAICRTLEQITPKEAENLTSVVFKLYPQFEEKIREELAEQFG